MDSNLERGKEVVAKKKERALLDIHLPIHIQKDFHVLDHVQETSLGIFPSFQRCYCCLHFGLSAIAFNQMSNVNLEGLACVKCVNHIR
jgi:hypothetical protein